MTSKKRDNDQRLSQDDAASYLGVKPKTLAQWRWRGAPRISFVKLGKSVWYWKSDLDLFIESCVRQA